jgi:3-phosphoshikimate 1-carboxyvinyltransferase
MIPNLIDEIPVLAVLAATMKGTTVVRDAEELRHKESDRIRAVVDNLTAMGVKVGEFPDGFAIEGTGEINGAEIDTADDHRIAMAFSVAGLVGHGNTIIKNRQVVDISCPRFYTMLEGLRLK